MNGPDEYPGVRETLEQRQQLAQAAAREILARSSDEVSRGWARQVIGERLTRQKMQGVQMMGRIRDAVLSAGAAGIGMREIQAIVHRCDSVVRRYLGMLREEGLVGVTSHGASARWVASSEEFVRQVSAKAAQHEDDEAEDAVPIVRRTIPAASAPRLVTTGLASVWELGSRA